VQQKRIEREMFVSIDIVVRPCAFVVVPSLSTVMIVVVLALLPDGDSCLLLLHHLFEGGRKRPNSRRCSLVALVGMAEGRACGREQGRRRGPV
jgi:hypothetical protein